MSEANDSEPAVDAAHAGEAARGVQVALLRSVGQVSLGGGGVDDVDPVPQRVTERPPPQSAGVVDQERLGVGELIEPGGSGPAERVDVAITDDPGRECVGDGRHVLEVAVTAPMLVVVAFGSAGPVGQPRTG